MRVQNVNYGKLKRTVAFYRADTSDREPDSDLSAKKPYMRALVFDVSPKPYDRSLSSLSRAPESPHSPTTFAASLLGKRKNVRSDEISDCGAGASGAAHADWYHTLLNDRAWTPVSLYDKVLKPVSNPVFVQGIKSFMATQPMGGQDSAVPMKAILSTLVGFSSNAEESVLRLARMSRLEFTLARVDCDMAHIVPGEEFRPVWLKELFSLLRLMNTTVVASMLRFASTSSWSLSKEYEADIENLWEIFSLRSAKLVAQGCNAQPVSAQPVVAEPVVAQDLESLDDPHRRHTYLHFYPCVFATLSSTLEDIVRFRHALEVVLEAWEAGMQPISLAHFLRELRIAFPSLMSKL